jgi:regulator of nonsense transcripts 3
MSTVATTAPAPAPTTTPLLEALKAEKAAQREKDSIIRNHAHYRDTSFIGPSAAAKGGHASKPGVQDRVSLGKKDRMKGTNKEKSTPTVPPVTPEKKGKKIVMQKAVQPAATANTSKGGGVPTVPVSNIASPPKQSSEKPAGRGGRRGATGAVKGQQSTPVSVSTTADATTVPIDSSTSGSAQAGDAPLGPAATTTQSAGAGPGGRRGRSVLGAASRHFEVALSGAGVRAGRTERPTTVPAHIADTTQLAAPLETSISRTTTTAATTQFSDQVMDMPAAVRGGGGRRGRGRGRGRGGS